MNLEIIAAQYRNSEARSTPIRVEWTDILDCPLAQLSEQRHNIARIKAKSIAEFKSWTTAPVEHKSVVAGLHKSSGTDLRVTHVWANMHYKKEADVGKKVSESLKGKKGKKTAQKSVKAKGKKKSVKAQAGKKAKTAKKAKPG